MTTHGPFTFDTQVGADADAWTFVSDNGANGLNGANTARAWSHDVDNTVSTNVGPDHGQGGNPDGYVHPEASSPNAFGDTYHMTFNTVLDASAEQWQFNFYTNQRGDNNNATCEVQINESGGGWTTVATFGGSGDPNKVATGGAHVWASRSVDLSQGGANTDSSTQVRILITMPASGTAWHNDYGIDTIEIVGTTLQADGAGMTLATADKLIATDGSENPGIFNFEKSLPWGAISIPLPRAAAQGETNLSPGSTFTTIKTSTFTVRNGATIDGLIIDGDVVLDEVLDLTNVTITGNLTLNTAGTYNFDNVTVAGDTTNADGSANTQINSTNGSNVTTSEPGTGNGQVNIINSVTLSITVFDEDTGAPIENARVNLHREDNKTEVLNGATNASGVVTSIVNYSSDFNILGWARQMDLAGLDYTPKNISGVVTSNGFTITVNLKRI